MEPTQPQLSQKEYLKKYLSKDKGEKKKKKKLKISSSSHIKRSVIIDDDLGLPGLASIDDEEFNLEYLGDEAPQIAGVIDERPAEVRAKESYGDANKWKAVDEPDESFIKNLIGKLGPKESILNGESTMTNISSRNDRNVDLELKKKESKLKKYGSDSDASPPRTKDKNKSEKYIQINSDDSDESPPRKKNRGKYSDKTISKNKNGVKSKDKYESDSDSDLSGPRKKDKFSKNTDSKNRKKNKYSDSDTSPPRRKDRSRKENRGTDSDRSPPRKSDKTVRGNEYDNKQHKLTKPTSDSDMSPPRRKNRNHRDNRGSDSDFSPLRKRDKIIQGKESYNKSHKSNKHNSDSDVSPTRRGEKNISENYKSNKYDNNSDLSPPRKKDRNNFDKEVSKKNNRDSDSDVSPPRRRDKSENDRGKPLKSRSKNNDSDSDLSPPRRKDRTYQSKDYDSKKQRRNKGSDSDLSPPRRRDKDKGFFSKNRKYNNKSDSDLSPPRRNDKRKDSSSKSRRRKEDSDSDLSPPRKQIKDRSDKKLDKTLDGKKAGLQNAKNLKDELRKLRENEDAAFSRMQSSVSGQNATAIKRDRKTGRIRDLEKERQVTEEKSARARERENKYSKWGKGLKQIEQAEERLADALHEANKPLARYAGDDDLEKILKDREREGDPMLDYIRSKQDESISIDNIGKPKYQGHFMPNRFGIRPGHRWDGVDRSNGYEKKWFERQNARKAVQEEAYKWSTSDM